MNTDIQDKILEIISNLSETSQENINKHIKFNDLPNWSSLMFVQMIAELESEFGISIPLEKIEDLQTPQDIIDLLP